MVDVSLVICTRNRASRLRKCLDSVVAARSSVSRELVIVNNASTDGTAELIAGFAQSAPMRVTTVDEPTPGVGRAKNAGWKMALGSLIAFTDDDCYIAPDFFDQVAKAFVDPRLGYFGGRVRLYDPGDYPTTIKESEVPQSLPPRSFLPAGEIHGANMAFRKKVLEELNGFDPVFGPGTPFICEDVDALARASFAGWWGAYVPEVVVFHHHGRKLADIPALERAYAVGRGAYMVKFILHRGSRRVYLRRWRWRLQNGLFRSAERLDCLQELLGGTRYLGIRIKAWLVPKELFSAARSSNQLHGHRSR